MSIKISAIICTYNRGAYLSRAIKSLAAQTLPKEEFEILIIDNGSCDNTQDTVKSFAGLKNLRYLKDPILGLSQARNTGWCNSGAEYVAYLDDDAEACPEWLEKIIEVFETVKPKPGCVTGKIEPVWEKKRPKWLSDELLLNLTVADWLKVPGFLNSGQWAAGANIAFPKKILAEVGGFKPELGRKGNKLLSMEEVFLREELENRGQKVFYHPDICVKHHIPAERLRKNWFKKRSFYNGVSSAYMQIYREKPSFFQCLTKGFTTLLRIALSPKELLPFLLPTSNPVYFAKKCSVMARVGHVLALWGFALKKIVYRLAKCLPTFSKFFILFFLKASLYLGKDPSNSLVELANDLNYQIPVMARLGNNMKIIVTWDFYGAGIYRDGWVEIETVELFKRLIRPGMVFLDIGAHVGMYTLLASELVGVSGQVISFEPNSHIYRLLLKNARLNKLGNVILNKFALSDETGRKEFFLSSAYNTGKSSLMSLDYGYSGENIQVECLKLDDYLKSKKIERVDVIKIDVEGAELKVFRGAEELLKRTDKPAIVIEFNRGMSKMFGYSTGQLAQYLMEHGYSLYRINFMSLEKYFPTETDPNVINVLALPREKEGAYFEMLKDITVK